MSPDSLSFTYVEGADSVDPRIVDAQFRGDGIVVGYPPGATDNYWLSASELDHTGSSARFNVWASTGLAPGAHQTTLRFVTGRVNQNGEVSHIKYKDVAVTLTITPNDLALSGAPTSLAFESYQDGALPEGQLVELTFNGDSVLVESQPTWLQVEGTQGDGSATFSVRPSTTSGSGTRQGTVTFRTSRANNSKVQRFTVNVTYVTRPHIAASGTLGASQFTFGSSAATAAGTLNVTATTQAWAATSSAGWLTVDGGTHSGSAQLPLQIDTGGLAIGTHSASITVTNVDEAAETATYTATVNVVPPVLDTSAGSLLIGGSDGLATGGATLGFQVNTGLNAWPWTLTLDAGDWGSLDLESGTVSGSGQGVTVNADRDAVVGGTYTGSAALSVNVNGYVLSKNVSVTFKKEAERFYVSHDGVAFVRLPSRQVLSRDITVTSTLDRAGSWTAESDQAWLSVTSSGTTGGTLTLTADPTGLAANQTHIATVTVTPDSASIENAPTVRVGLWIGDDPLARIQIPLAASRVATSPVEPLAFTNTAGVDLISTYNVYTGELVRSFAAGTSNPDALRTSSDGLKLFVVDRDTSEVRVLDATTGALLGHHAFQNTAYLGIAELAYARPGALPAVLIGNGTMIDLASGTVTTGGPGSGYYESGHIRVSPDSKAAYVVNDGSSPSTLIRYKLTRTALGAGLRATTTGSVQPGYNGEDLVVSPDGSRLYTADGAPYYFNVYDATTLASLGTRAGQPYPNNAAVSWKGVFAGGTYSYYDPVDIFFYDPAGTSLGTVRCAGTDYTELLRDSLQFSGDGLRLTCATEGFSPEASLLNFLDAPAY